MDNQEQQTYRDERSRRQGQPNTDPSQQSRTIVQPIVLGTITFASSPTQTTVGSAGSASALPATPTGYLQFNIGNANYVVPFYAAS